MENRMPLLDGYREWLAFQRENVDGAERCLFTSPYQQARARNHAVPQGNMAYQALEIAIAYPA